MGRRILVVVFVVGLGTLLSIAQVVAPVATAPSTILAAPAADYEALARTVPAEMDRTIAVGEPQYLATLRMTAAQEDWTPPAYAKADSFHEREVTIGASPWQLPGTLTLPNGLGPFPAVVLVHDSGLNDHDESVGPNKMFKDLAWGLAGRGIAVLRYDKRTRTYGSDIMQLTDLTVKEEIVDDARAAANLLSSQPEIQGRRVCVLGHGLGGYVGPRIAAGDATIAGLILLAGSTSPMEDLAVQQVRYLALKGKITPQGQEAIERVEKEAAAIRNPDLKSGTTVTLLGIPMPSTYFLDLRGYHPAEMAATLHIPIQVLQGNRDFQVPMTDFDGWRKFLANPTNSLKVYPSLNHLFMPGSGSPSETEYFQPNHVPEEVIREIARFVRRNAR